MRPEQEIPDEWIDISGVTLDPGMVMRDGDLVGKASHTIVGCDVPLAERVIWIEEVGCGRGDLAIGSLQCYHPVLDLLAIGSLPVRMVPVDPLVDFQRSQ